MDIQPAEFLNVQMHLASDNAGPPSHDSSSPSTSPNSMNMPTIMELLQTTFCNTHMATTLLIQNLSPLLLSHSVTTCYDAYHIRTDPTFSYAPL